MSLIESKKSIYINSRDRTTGTDSDFIIPLNIDLGQKYTHVCVMQLALPKTYYLITSGSNFFTLQEGIATAVITITPGNYNRRSLANVVKSQLNAGSPNSYTYTMAYPNPGSAADTGKFLWSVSGNAGVQPKFIFTSYVWEPLGFDAHSTNSFAASSLNSTNVIKLQAEDTLYVNCDITSNGGAYDSVLQEIFCATGDPYNANIWWVCPDVEAYSKQLSIDTPKKIRIWLTDESFNPISTNGANMVLSLLFWRELPVWRMLKGFIKMQAYMLGKDNNKDTKADVIKEFTDALMDEEKTTTDIPA